LHPPEQRGRILQVMIKHRLSLALLLTFAPFAGAASATPNAPLPSAPVVLELFTSQGCSSCPPANAALAQEADRPDVIALSFGVTYWDYLGWKDTFARREFTDRQRAYVRAFGEKSPFTPQVVAGGRHDSVGNSKARLDALIEASRAPPAAQIKLGANVVQLSAGAAPRGGADVWLVRYQPGVVQVPVRAGENTGRTLPHSNVVRQLVRLGRWNGAAAALPLPPGDPALKSVVLLQGPGGGPILAAARR
jgi:hypothetical protein